MAKSFVLLFLIVPSIYGQQKANPVKIFVLAGQSNMEGKGSVVVMEHQLTDTAKQARFADYKTGDQWKTRDDVWIDYLGNHGRRSGGLTVGYGISQENSRELFGPELGFGWTVGDHIKEPVLIIKTAWGGKSLDRDFRPPSRGYSESLNEEYEKAHKNNQDLTLEAYKQTYGHFYREMIGEVRRVTSDLKSYVPGYENQGFEIDGFVWFQGWNDQYAPTSVADYHDNLVALIKDVRADLGVPQLPFVIGAMGHDGTEQKGKIKQIADAQVAVAELADFRGNVATIRTSQFWDTEAAAAYQKYWADEKNRNVDKWREFGNDHGYHYFGSPIFFNDAGVAFGKAMIKLLDSSAQ